VGAPWWAVKIDDASMASLYKIDGPFGLKEEAASIFAENNNIASPVQVH
jgi:hypothetical protein